MKHDVSFGKQSQSGVHSAPLSITTLLISRNTFLHVGLEHILSGTQFELVDDVLDPTSDVSAFAGSERVLILLCVRLSFNEHLETLARLKAQCPSAWVVILDDYLEPDAIVHLYKAGFNGLCSPTMSASGLVKALELVVAGEKFIPAALGLALLEQSRQSTADTQASQMTPPSRLAERFSDREIQILQCLMQGDSNKVIGYRLGLTEATVKVHLKSILRKVQAANRTQAAMWAREHLLMVIPHLPSGTEDPYYSIRQSGLTS
jgi:two-component system nitrate/nitrite response regulator NarL